MSDGSTVDHQISCRRSIFRPMTSLRRPLACGIDEFIDEWFDDGSKPPFNDDPG